MMAVSTPATLWRAHLIALGLAWVGLLAMFFKDVGQMVQIWINASTYNHCPIIVALAGWSAWQRRHELAPLTPKIWWPALIATMGAAVLWLLGEAGSLALFRQAALVFMLQSLVPLLLGKTIARGLLFPIVYLVFAIPFGEELLPILQTITAEISIALLHLAGVPAIMNGIFISTPNGYYKVAEACAGVKFLLAMVAYGALVANICFRSWKKRAAFMVLCCVGPILANGVRAYATIHIGYLTSPEIAGGFDHIVYGWVFFALVMAGIVGVGWPFFDRKPGDPWLSDTSRLTEEAGRPPLWVGVVAGLLVPASALGWSVASLAMGAQPLHGVVRLPEVAGWQRVDSTGQAPWGPHFKGADQISLAHYRNDKGEIVDLALIIFAQQSEGKEAVGFGQGAAGVDEDLWVWSSQGPMFKTAKSEWLTAPGAVQRLAVSRYLVRGRITGSAAEVKLHTMAARLFGQDQAAAVLIFSAQDGQGQSAEAALRRFEAGLPSVDQLMPSLLNAARR